jgi:hypothetical protein
MAGSETLGRRRTFVRNNRVRVACVVAAVRRLSIIPEY